MYYSPISERNLKKLPQRFDKLPYDRFGDKLLLSSIYRNRCAVNEKKKVALLLHIFIYIL